MNYANLPDEALVLLTAKADKEALSALYDRYGGRVYSLAMKLLGDRGQAEEVMQDTFVRIWQGASSYSADRGTFPGWLMSIAHNRVVDELRRRRRSPEGASLDGPIAMGIADGDPGPPEQLLTQERAHTVKQALTQLPEAQQKVIALAYFQGLTQTEIADRLGAPLGTVKTRMRLALQKLKALLAPAPQGSEANR